MAHRVSMNGEARVRGALGLSPRAKRGRLVRT